MDFIILILYFLLILSNNYKIIKISLANRDGAELKLDGNDFSILFEQIKPHKNDSRFNKMIEIAKDKIGKNILLVVVSKKQNDNNFKIPLQGKYLNDISNFKTDYNLQDKGSANADNQISDNTKRE